MTSKKKKTSDITFFSPFNTSSVVGSIPQVVEKAASVPDYSDSGVRYEGKYRRPISGDVWEQRNQVIKHYRKVLNDASQASGNANDRGTTNKFYVTKVILQYTGASRTVLPFWWGESSDTTSLAGEMIKIYLYETFSFLELDYSASPIEIKERYLNYFHQALAAGTFLIIDVWGFEEQ